MPEYKIIYIRTSLILYFIELMDQSKTTVLRTTFLDAYTNLLKCMLKCIGVYTMVIYGYLVCGIIIYE